LASLADGEYMSDPALQAAAEYEIKQSKQPNVFLLPVPQTAPQLELQQVLPEEFEKIFAVQFTSRLSESEGHWALHFIDFDTKSLWIFDSSPSYNSDEEHRSFQDYLESNLIVKYPNVQRWTKNTRSEVKPQFQGYECGDMVLAYIRTILLENIDQIINVNPADEPKKRPLTAVELLKLTVNGRALLANLEEDTESATVKRILDLLHRRFLARKNKEENDRMYEIPATTKVYIFTQQQQQQLDP
jgi:hypothetical protein